ncbi:hypothetical protein WDU99_01925 [Microbacterium sp. Mu-80]|uniref:Uncharacterized protein n=1 Tax=Microbacterium bandirmense TaxID=3122050 RepID=A0ABU8L7T5_9MICO
MNRGKQCPARAVIFIDDEKANARCIHFVEYHHDQAIEDEVVYLSHRVRFADGTSVTWQRDGEIIHASSWPAVMHE